jgi:hypothetical protein
VVVTAWNKVTQQQQQQKQQQQQRRSAGARELHDMVVPCVTVI